MHNVSARQALIPKTQASIAAKRHVTAWHHGALHQRPLIRIKMRNQDAYGPMRRYTAHGLRLTRLANRPTPQGQQEPRAFKPAHGESGSPD